MGGVGKHKAADVTDRALSPPSCLDGRSPPFSGSTCLILSDTGDEILPLRVFPTVSCLLWSGPEDLMPIVGCGTLLLTSLFPGPGVVPALQSAQRSCVLLKRVFSSSQHLQASLLAAGQCQSHCSLMR